MRKAYIRIVNSCTNDNQGNKPCPLTLPLLGLQKATFTKGMHIYLDQCVQFYRAWDSSHALNQLSPTVSVANNVVLLVSGRQDLYRRLVIKVGLIRGVDALITNGQVLLGFRNSIFPLPPAIPGPGEKWSNMSKITGRMAEV